VAAEREALRFFAGSQGTDLDGRRLDRREFEETRNSLSWLAAAQMGWYRNQGRYQGDLLGVFGDQLTGMGLPEDNGVTLQVSKEGDAWYSWRRTIAGWCFAIGATGPPPDRWEYDGPHPPTGFPGRDPAWGSEPFSDEVNKNWT